MKYLLRAGLAVAMLVGFYVLAIALALALALAAVEALRLVTGVDVGATAVVLVVPAVLALGYGIFFRTKEIPPHRDRAERVEPAAALGRGSRERSRRADQGRRRDPLGPRGERGGLRLRHLAGPATRHAADVRRRSAPAGSGRTADALGHSARVRALRRPSHHPGPDHLSRRRVDPPDPLPARSAQCRRAGASALRPALLRRVAVGQPAPGARGRPARRPGRGGGGHGLGVARAATRLHCLGELPGRLQRDGTRHRTPTRRGAGRLRGVPRRPDGEREAPGGARGTVLRDAVRLRHASEHRPSRGGAGPAATRRPRTTGLGGRAARPARRDTRGARARALRPLTHVDAPGRARTVGRG